MLDNASDLQRLFDQRAVYYGSIHQDMDTMVNVYDGGLPEEYMDMFHEEMHVHIINNIRLAWDDLAWMAGKEFPIYVRPEGETAEQKRAAERLEQVGYGYNRAGRRAGGLTMKSLMKVLMWWLVGTASSVAMVLPDYQNKTPFFTWRDPRTFYPPVGWTPWNETRSSDALFAYQKSLAQLEIEYPEHRDELRQSIQKIYNLGDPSVASRTGMSEDEIWLWVGEYYHEDSWHVATLEDRAVTLARSDTGDAGHPGVQPAVAMSLFSGSDSAGRSLFADQVSIQAALSRMFSQKLDFFDRTLYPVIFTTPLAGKTVKIGPFAVNEFDIGLGINPRVDAIGPTNAIDADQTMQFAIGLSRILNRNDPGQAADAANADSAKALDELRKGITTTIREGIWPAAVETLPTLYSSAAKMDINLWGDTTKRARGTRKNADFQVQYRPRPTLKGHEHDFEVDPGVGLAGYQGTLEIMQLVGAKLMSEDTALEQLESTREPQKEKRRIQAGKMEELMWASLATRAQGQPGMPGTLKTGAMGIIRKRTDDGEDLFDVVAAMEKTGELYEEAPPAPPAGGIPPGAAGTGSPASFMPLPTLEAFRGGPGTV